MPEPDTSCPVCGTASDWVTVCGDVIQMACPEGHPDWSVPVQPKRSPEVPPDAKRSGYFEDVTTSGPVKRSGDAHE